MKTARFDPHLESDVIAASECLARGGCVAFPTETVYGLGVDATNEIAVEKAFIAKGRPSDNPLIVHLHSPDQLALYCHSIPQVAYKLIEKFCPGPLTIVLPRKGLIVPSVTAGLETVAIRFPNHPTALRLLRMSALPIAAPSANRSGRPSSTTWQAVAEDLDGRIDGILCDEPSTIGIESTVIDVTGQEPTVLRSGGVSLEQLRAICPNVRMFSAIADPVANSPGLRHRHYQPKCKVVLVDFTNTSGMQASESTTHGLTIGGISNLLTENDPVNRGNSVGFIGISEPPSELVRFFQRVLICRDVDEYAKRLFTFFRTCDAEGLQAIVCETVGDTGIGRALMDRLQRAATI